MRHTVVLIGLLGVVGWGQAESADLHKCTDKAGQVSIQSEPCPSGWTLVWKRDAAPEQPLSDAQHDALQQRRQREASEARQLAQMAGMAPALPKPMRESEPQAASEADASAAKLPEHRCRQAHDLAHALRTEDFLELSNYQLSRLSEWVAERCKDPD